MIIRLLNIAAHLLWISCSFAQNPRGVITNNKNTVDIKENTYALIVGISKYESTRNLSYADKDATIFYQYLRSSAGGSIDSANIKLLLNQNAKAGNIWEGIKWLVNKADSIGETAIIYFAGHGDGTIWGDYLLAYDAPREGDEKYNVGGAIRVEDLKKGIKIMVTNQVKVMLITDACRTREKSDRVNPKWRFQSITSERAGEVQMTSCADNEESMEGISWGNGRGVFSFHLINGLTGLADANDDGVVTFYELQRYVIDRVIKDSRESQNPFFWSEKNQMIIAKVDPATKLLVKKAIEENNGEVMYAYAPSKKVDFFSDPQLQKLYIGFTSAIEKKELIESSGTSAKDILDKLLASIKDSKVRKELSTRFAAELLNEAQIRITRYTKPPVEDTTDILNYTFFNTGAQLLDEALRHIDKSDKMWKEAAVRKYFLEARALYELGGQGNIQLALLKIDSSINMDGTAYGYHTKGLLLSAFGKNYREALKYYDLALSLNPDWSFTLTNKGQIYTEMKKLDSARFYLMKALSQNPNHAWAWSNFGNLLNNIKKYDSALLCLSRSVELMPNSPISWNGLANVFFDAKKYDSALFYYYKSLRVKNSYLPAFENLANTYFNLKKYDSAKKYSSKALALEPFSNSALTVMGSIFYRLNQTDSAKAYYSKALNADSQSSVSWLNYGNTYSDAGNYDSALFYFKKAILLDSTNDLAFNNLGRLYFKMEKYDSAVGCFHEAIKLNPNDGDCYNNLGVLFRRVNNTDSALFFYQKALQLDTSNPLYLGNIANLYRDIKLYDSAKKYYHAAVKIPSASEVVWHGWALLCQQTNQPDSAKLLYHQALAINPRYHVSLNNLGNLHHTLKNMDSAKYYLRKGLSVNKRFENLYNNLGRVFFDEKEYDSAKSFFKKWTELNPNTDLSWSWLGTAYYQLKKMDSAIACFSKVYVLNPRDSWNITRIGNSFYSLRLYDSAMKYYFVAISVDNKNWTPYSMIGAIFFEQQKFDSATMYLSKALSFDIKNKDIKDFLAKSIKAEAESLYQKSQFIEAIQKYFDALQINEYDSSALYNIACCYSRIKDKGKGLKYLEDSIKAGFTDFSHIESDKDFEWLWADDDFMRLIKQYKSGG